MLPGLREGISGMREGGIRYLLVPPQLAFGEAGKPPAIGPSTWLMFRIELLGVSRDEPDKK